MCRPISSVRSSASCIFIPHRGVRPQQPAAAEIGLEEDAPEEIDSLHYDLAAPLVEEFVLAIDPYPRAPGVAFRGPGRGRGGPQKPLCRP